MAFILDGKEAASEIKSRVANFIEWKRTTDVDFAPKLAIVQIGENTASSIYVRQKEKACAETGILSSVLKLDDKKQVLHEAATLINKLNNNKSICGILLQLPLPESIQYATGFLVNKIDPKKDVDCLTDVRLGELYSYKKYNGTVLAPCTPAGIIELASAHKISFSGKHCVIVGRSDLVAKPLASLLLTKDATVTICHSKTQNLSDYTKSADVLISATGQRHLITPDMVKKDVVVFDVGITRDENNKLCGDVHPDVQDVASYITPVPGGVGPMTVAMLMHNTLTLALTSTLTNSERKQLQWGFKK